MGWVLLAVFCFCFLAVCFRSRPLSGTCSCSAQWKVRKPAASSPFCWKARFWLDFIFHPELSSLLLQFTDEYTLCLLLLAYACQGRKCPHQKGGEQSWALAGLSIPAALRGPLDFGSGSESLGWASLGLDTPVSSPGVGNEDQILWGQLFRVKPSS